MVEPINTSLFTIPEGLSHIVNGRAKISARSHTPKENSSINIHSHTMPIIGGHKSISSLLHISSGSQKGEGRKTFSPYAGSLSSEGSTGRAAKGGGGSGQSSVAEAAAPMPTTPMSMGTSMTVNVRYVAKDMWRKVTFPPGITVTQARDICMLRFNIWQQSLETSPEPAVDTPSTAVGATFDQPQEQQQSPPLDGSKDETPRVQASAPQGIHAPKSSGATAGFMGTVGVSGPGSQKSQNQFREQYGLFWTSAGHWLDADEMLSAYILRKGEVLELQHIVDFVLLQPHEFRYSYAESPIYHLEPEGEEGAVWQLRWLVLRNRVLRVYKEKGAKEPDLDIDLNQRFRLTDQDARSWPRSSSKTGSGSAASGMSRENNSASSLIETPSIQALLDVPLPSGKSSGECGMFIVQMLGTSINTSDSADATATGLLLPQRNSLNIQSYAFRSCNLADYQVWHRTLRQTLSSSINGVSGGANGGATGTGYSMSGSASISGASNHSNDMAQSSESTAPTNGAQGAGSGRAYAGAQQGPASALSPNMGQKPKAPMSSTRHKGYVNRKAPDGYGFRRRYCVLTPNVLFGFLHSDDCKDDSTEDKLMPTCEFAISLDPLTVTIEAIAWNGRYLLRVFGPESRIIRDKPRTTVLQPNESSRIHCTDILATAAEAAIEQYGSTFGMMPDSQELVRLMIDDHEEGQTWVVGFNNISGLQITGRSRVLISARRLSSMPGSKPLQASIRPGLLDGASAPSDAAASPNAGAFRQQSLGEFMGGEIDSLAESDEKQAKAPPRYRQPQQQQQSPQRAIAESAPQSSGGAGSSETKTPAEPKWIPLSIDKYIKEEEERKRHQGASSGNGDGSVAGGGADPSGSGDGSHGRVLRPKPSNVGNGERSDAYGGGQYNQHYQNGYDDDHSSGGAGARPPPRFNWFKRRGSTSK
ncbi:hypothetical protein IW140_001947 [Coemansia sp. RSA 1813]|nr:hypothetical protein EV178_001569 [Coemansia sp. RSA 1646]KAJ1771634.1 hypothetical protein LPJ74_002189 [Coemansia sp. RSA 1843]KAJ2089936.1 hypothetical protein IW138_003066 [Coemansia sp. RSA 986]KAJ2215253.1 hypothetical protein EV179_002341 [Coemansia sp. RSA 487]KAJ2570993.1 hypothetical protein IW140_001947 [Coemansia sp. RSA 1813]